MANKIIVDLEFNQGEASKRVAGLRAELQGLSTERSKLSKQLKELQKDEKANADEIQRVASELNRVENTTKATRKEINILNSGISAVNGSLNEKRANLKRLNNEYDNFRVDIDGTGKELNDLGKTIKELSDDIKAQEESTGRAQRSVGDYGKALRDAFSGDLSGIKDLRANIQGLGAALLTPAGLIAGLGTAAVGATVKFAEFSKELARDRREIEQLTGATGDLSGRLAGAARALEKTFNADSEKSLIALNTLTRELGGDIEENFNQLSDAAALVGPQYDEVLDIVKEYPALFRGLNVEADEFLAIATQQVKDGFFSDKGVDAIKEGLISLREMPKATRQALDAIGISADDIQERVQAGTTTLFDEVQRVSTRLTELSDQSPEYGQAVADIFRGAGEDAGPRFFETLTNINTEFDELIDGATEAQKQQIELSRANKTIEQTFDALFASSGEFFLGAEVGAKKLFAEGLVFVIEGVESLINGFVDLYNESFVVRAGLNQVFANIKTAIDVVVGGFQLLLNSVSTIGKTIGAILRGDFSSITDIIAEGFQNAKGIVVDTAQDIGQNYVDAFENTVNGRLEKVDLLPDAGKKAEDAGKKAGKAFGDNFKSEAEKSTTDVSTKTTSSTKKSKNNDKELERERKTLAKQQAEIAKLEKKAAEDKLKNQAARLKRELLQVEESGAKRINILIKLAQTERDLLLQNDRLLSEERLLIQAQTQEKINKLGQEALDAQKKLVKELSKKERNKESGKKVLDALFGIEDENLTPEELIKKGVDDTLAGAQELGAILTEAADERARIRIEEIKSNDNLSESEKETAIATITAEKERSKAYKAGKAVQKAAAIAEMGVNLGRQLSQIFTTASAISGAAPPFSVPVGIAYGVVQSALALAQSAQRVAQIRALEEGGMTTVQSGPNGITHNGIPVATDSGLFDRGGFVRKPTLSIMGNGQPAITGEGNKTEYVVSSKMLQIPQIRAAVGDMESLRLKGLEYGGYTSFRIPAFQDGGFGRNANQAILNNDLVREMVGLLKNPVSPRVSVVDINKGQKNRAIVEESGNI